MYFTPLSFEEVIGEVLGGSYFFFKFYLCYMGSPYSYLLYIFSSNQNILCDSLIVFVNLEIFAFQKMWYYI